MRISELTHTIAEALASIRSNVWRSTTSGLKRVSTVVNMFV
jgi:hypothetical protein